MLFARTNYFSLGGWLLAFGYWLFVIGYWLLAIGYWLLAIGYQLNIFLFFQWQAILPSAGIRSLHSLLYSLFPISCLQFFFQSLISHLLSLIFYLSSLLSSLKILSKHHSFLPNNPIVSGYAISTKLNP